MIPPNSLDAEEMLLGKLIADNDRIIDVINTLKSDDFYGIDHQKIYKAIVDLHLEGRAADIITISDKLGKDSEEIGGVGKLSHCIAESFGVDVNEYADIIVKKSKSRKVMTLGHKLIDMSKREDIESSVELINNFSIESEKGIELNSLKHLMDSFDEGRSRKGFLTGIDKIDEFTYAMKAGHFWAIGGYNGTGKSQFLVQILTSALEQGAKIMFFTMEMPEDDLMDRFWRYKKYKLLGNRIREEDERESEDMAMKFFLEKEHDLHITSKVYSLENVKNMVLSGDYDIVAIDFIQLMESNGKSEYDTLTIIARELQLLAQRSGTCIIALSQISEEAQRNRNDNVMGFKGSGGIGNAVNVGIILRRDFKNEYGQSIVDLDVLLKKNRHGRTGLIEMKFDKEDTGFII